MNVTPHVGVDPLYLIIAHALSNELHRIDFSVQRPNRYRLTIFPTQNASGGQLLPHFVGADLLAECFQQFAQFSAFGYMRRMCYEESST